MIVTWVRVLSASCMLAGVASGQAPTVEKVEPPNWWTGSSVNPVRILIRDRKSVV